MTPEERKEEFKKWALTQPKNDKGATYAKRTIDGYCRKIINVGITYPAINNLSYPGNLFECADRNTISTIYDAIYSMSDKDNDYPAALHLYLRFLEPDPLDKLIEKYSEVFQSFRKEELYKWKAIKQFQDVWNPDADNFAAMLESALSGTSNLLQGNQYYRPRELLQDFAEMNPIKTCHAFIDLFDENRDLQTRMKQFEQVANELLKEYNKKASSLGKKSEPGHYQSPRAMSVYLSLRYPENYYLYMYKIYTKIADRLCREQKSDKFECFADYIAICAEMIHRLELKHPKVIEDSDSLLPDDLRAVDPEHHLLVQDILYYSYKYSDDQKGKSQYAKDEGEVVKQEVRPGSNIILYGPPGTGKTYNVAAMAWLISRGIDPALENVRSLTDEQRVEAKTWYDTELADHENGHVAFTTFHQSYGYEEFIEGIRPVIPESNDLEVENDIGYTIEDGVFKAFCNRASASDVDGNDDPYIFVIDEINRGNISKVFGELITLIEPSKRIGQPDQQTAILPYTKKPFGVPANVTIIGTMNTADRSIALMDTALRRRFRFIEMMPDYDALQCIPEFDGISISKLVECMNRRISVLYDREHTIGHAYFMELVEEPNINTLATIFEERIIPLLQEYFYDDYEKICLVLGDNQKSDDAIKFFVEINSYTSDELFGVTAAYDDVCSYQMNRKALDDPQAYIGIYSQA